MKIRKFMVGAAASIVAVSAMSVSAFADVAGPVKDITVNVNDNLKDGMLHIDYADVPAGTTGIKFDISFTSGAWGGGAIGRNIGGDWTQDDTKFSNEDPSTLSQTLDFAKIDSGSDIELQCWWVGDGTMTVKVTYIIPEEDKPGSLDPGTSPTDPTNTPSSSTGTSTTTTTTTTPTEEATALEDKDTGVKLDAAKGVVEAGTELKVAPATDENADTAAFDITLTKDGKAVQPNGKVTVKVPVPEKFKSASKLYVYRVDDGKYVELSCKLESGFVVFETDHFSKYVISSKALGAGTASPATGVALAVTPVILAGCFVVVAAKKRK